MICQYCLEVEAVEGDDICEDCYDEQIAQCEADIATEKRCEEFYENGY